MDLSTWLTLLAFLVTSANKAYGSCDLKTCSENFLGRTKKLAETTKEYCVYLHAYSKCLKLQEKSCRGDFAFHGTRSAVEELIASHPHCQGLLATDEDFLDEADALSNLLQDRSPHETSNRDVCRYSGPSPMSHCALFGDPHLVTFNGDHLACVVRGAWPLLATQHLAIQVTNQPVSKKSRATAVTKVTVIIKSLSDTCGLGATYEASEDLPKAFVDGQTFSPVGWVTEISPGNHVVVHVAAINATVAIRRVDRFLQVHLSLPTSIADLKTEDVSLCSVGCQGSQKVDIDETDQFQNTLNEQDAKTICTSFNLTDHYLDSCMFDIMTTGERSFGKAAFLAQRDMAHLNPQFRMSQKNCTTWPCEWPVSRGTTGRVMWLTLLISMLCTCL